MVIGPDTTHAANKSEYPKIDSLLRRAFEKDAEAKLVKRLRKDKDMWHEMIKPWNGLVGGYAALSRMKSPDGWACLGPVAVRPEFQNGALSPNNENRRYWSFGTRLVQELCLFYTMPALPNMIERGFPEAIVVLGKKSFYERAGFNSERAQKLASPFPIEHTLIAKAGDDIPEETLVYPDAFIDFLPDYSHTFY
ncbi:MAG: N-acetyltransferase [Lentilitoribacter sp.]